jgi:LPXTG-motif cell wall-anchored protein
MRKIFKKMAAIAGVLAMTLTMNTMVFAADDIVLDGDGGASSLIGEYKASGGEYKYLGFATTKEATSDYKYLQITYKGDISCLRIEFNREDDSNEGPFWFNPDGQTLFFKTVDGSEIPLTPSKETTITLDLAAIGIDIGEFRGMHLHYLDPNMQEGSFTITDARFKTSDPNASGDSGSSKSKNKKNSGSSDSGSSNSSSASKDSSGTGANSSGTGTAGTAGGATDAPQTGSVTYPIFIALGGMAVAAVALIGSRKIKE